MSPLHRYHVSYWQLSENLSFKRPSNPTLPPLPLPNRPTPAVSLSYCPTASQSHCPAASQSHCPTSSLFHWPTCLSNPLFTNSQSPCHILSISRGRDQKRYSPIVSMPYCIAVQPSHFLIRYCTTANCLTVWFPHCSAVLSKCPTASLYR